MAVPVQTMVLRKQIVDNYSNYLATLKSRQSVSLSSEVVGQVQKIYVKSGDKVTKGSIIAKLRADREIASMNAQQATTQSRQEAYKISQKNLESAKARQKEAKENLEINRKQYQRYQQLFKEQLISKTQLENYENKLIQAQSAYDALTAEESARRFDIQQARSNISESSAMVREGAAQIDKLNIRAPFAGTVGDIPVKEGDLVSTGTIIASVANVSSLEVYVNVPAEKINQLKIDSPIELVDSEGKVVGISKVSFISPTVDPSSQTVLVKANLVNNQNLLRDAQQVNSRIRWDASPGFLIPTTAVNRFGRSNFVFLVAKKGKADVAKMVQVELGEIQNGQYKVLSGLKERRIIITNGLEKLYDGAAIIVPNDKKSKKSKKSASPSSEAKE
ncbi:MAG: efflux RND transporter periplasmic adaptor subunit [Candidatus Caenarcaniphilales bacterium]|nr:efflux RND transporter periplasmic adaptor subunit [Candidatus Caenarcaniphilales bacterium]